MSESESLPVVQSSAALLSAAAIRADTHVIADAGRWSANQRLLRIAAGAVIVLSIVLVVSSIRGRLSPGVRDRPQGVIELAGDERKPEQLCVVDDPEISEASGLAISYRHPDCVWMHNDSGDKPRLFLVGPDGSTKAVITVRGEQPLDWEDMCSFTLDAEHWLLIGDFGDNGHVRGTSAEGCRLVLIREPKLSLEAAGKPTELEVESVATINFSYPDGPVNCESVAVDPGRREILLVSKTDPFNCRLFRLPLSLKPGASKLTAESLASPGIPFATGMDVTADGRSMVIVTMFNGALVQRAERESWSDALQRPAVLLEIPPMPQCETVCFTVDGTAVLLNSERAKQPLWKLPLPVTPSPPVE